MITSEAKKGLLKSMFLTTTAVLAVYVYLVPKGPDVPYTFMREAYRTSSRIALGGDLAPPVLEYGQYDLNGSYENIQKAVRIEFQGAYFSETKSGSVRSLMWHVNGVDFMLEEPSLPDHEKVKVGVSQGLSATVYHRIQFALFGPKLGRHD